ncbi:hypothetical protein AMATHDRAFT_64523 [Amanita thiersii Skay4041]|uniref:Nucleotide exchange factor Fes1 domain-containing protein n=1 Tax=Amanita thiersii Skay4041 TaxID=703135 RepID=A0A2A9NCV2_9AGAR|nr:hypothetical protein AMATHDRAFT_64523 [Amanita thiersii Skay4041]
MQSILRWSLAHSGGDGQDERGEGPSRIDPAKLDPGVIDMILGKPDAELMKEDLAVAVDQGRSEEERVQALDHFEMLVEQIDNANDLGKLKMWEPLQSLLTSETSTPAIQAQVLWVIGTALQNNPAAQDDYMQHHPLPTLLHFLTPSPSSTLQTRSKAIYALSGLLKHNSPAVTALGESGWTKLRDALQDPEITVRRKTMFLLSTLLTPNETSSASTTTAANIHGPNSLPNPTEEPPVSHATTQPIHANSHAAQLANPSRSSTSPLTIQAFTAHGILDAVISSLVSPMPYGEDGDEISPDVDFEEKAVRLLYTYIVICKVHLPNDQKKTIRAWISVNLDKAGSERQLADDLCLDVEELNVLVGSLNV